MQCLILVGLKRLDAGKTEVENLYTGQDGVELEKVANKAAESKAYSRIERLTNPMGAPMPIDPTPNKASKPTFPERKPKQAPKSAPAPKHIQDREDALRKQRAERFKTPNFTEQKPQDPKQRTAPRTDGPTINEFVAMGNKQEDYPPKGFLAKSEPFNSDKVAQLAAQYAKAAESFKKAGGPPAKPAGPPPKQPAPDTAGTQTSTTAPETAAEGQEPKQ